MELILSIETSIEKCSVAIFDKDALISSQSLIKEKAHSAKLIKIIHNTLEITSCKKQDIKAIAISSGPGSYTGLRVGVSTAKGLCFGLNIPLIDVNTLGSMAYFVNNFNTNKYLLCPMIDARRLEVYCSMFDSKMSLISGTEAKIINSSSFSDILNKEKVIFFGNGSEKTKQILINSNAIFINHISPNAEYLGHLAYKKYLKKEFVNLDIFEPEYIKSPVKLNLN